MFDFPNIDWAFPVETQPIFDRNGVEIPGNQAVVRTDTNDVLGVHGSRYQIVSHDDVVNSIMDAVKEVDLSKDYTFDVKIADGGRKMRGEVLFNNLVVQPAVGDIVKFRQSKVHAPFSPLYLMISGVAGSMFVMEISKFFCHQSIP